MKPVFPSIPQCNPASLVVELRDEISGAISRVLDSGRYILGEEVESFEKEWASWCGVEEAVGCANGTDALELILRSLDLPSGSLILAPSHTAVATIAAIVRSGHRPMLADVEPETYVIDPKSVARCLDAAKDNGDAIRAVIAVHLYGHPADLDSLLKLCADYKIPLVEDCSQAHGARWSGRAVGSFGVAAAFSLYPTKNLGALGDAGVITCSDAHHAARLRKLRQYGWEKTAISDEPGVNSRLDPLQAAILRVKLRLLHAHNSHRQEIASVYRDCLKDQSNIQLPAGKDSMVDPVYHQFVIQIPAHQRDIVREDLAKLGIGTLLHYPMAAHQMPAYRTTPTDPAGLLVTEALLPCILSLPMGTHFSLDQAQQIAERVLWTLEAA